MGEFFRIQPLGEIHVVELVLPALLDPMEFDGINEQILAELDGKANQKWILDLSEVSYMGSAMLGLMVNIRQRVKSAGGKLVLCGLAGRLTDIFRASSMERLFTITKSRADALKVTGR